MAKHWRAPLYSDRSKTDDLQVPGKSISGQSAVYIGLDFGTSFTKVVLGGAAARHPVLFDSGIGSNPFLLPSRLYILGEEKKCTLYKAEGNSGQILNDLKMPLIDRSFSDQARAHAAAYLALVLRHTRKWLARQDHGAIYRHRKIQWFVNVGLPTESDDDKQLKEAYLSIVRSAWRLSQSEEITLPNALSSVAHDLSDAMSGESFCVFPEFAAQIAGYARSPLGRDGLHANVDVGGGTLDFTVFNVVQENGEFRYPVFDRKVKPLGVRHLLAERFKRIGASQDELGSFFDNLPSDRDFAATYSLSEFELGELDASFRKNVQETIVTSLQYVKKRRDPRAPHWMPGHDQYGEGLRSFFCGGGARSDFYGRILREFEKDKPSALRLHSVKLEQPEDLKMPRVSVEHQNSYARLAVAYGLAQDPFNIGKITPKNEIKDELPGPPRSDSGNGYVGKELT